MTLPTCSLRKECEYIHCNALYGRRLIKNNRNGQMYFEAKSSFLKSRFCCEAHSTKQIGIEAAQKAAEQRRIQVLQNKVIDSFIYGR